MADLQDFAAGRPHGGLSVSFRRDFGGFAPQVASIPRQERLTKRHPSIQYLYSIPTFWLGKSYLQESSNTWPIKDTGRLRSEWADNMSALDFPMRLWGGKGEHFRCRGRGSFLGGRSEAALFA